MFVSVSDARFMRWQRRGYERNGLCGGADSGDCAGDRGFIGIRSGLEQAYYRNSSIDFNTYFGMIDPKETDDANADMQPMPPIKGLYHNSCMFSCPEDGCFRKRDILALRCPDVAKLKQWMCVRAHAFAEDCSNGEECASHSRIPQNKNLESAKEICDFYVAKTEEAISQYECKDSEGDFVPLEQHGMLITDVWKRGDLYTFFISSWYDCMSCGDNTRRTYMTVDSKTGKALD